MKKQFYAALALLLASNVAAQTPITISSLTTISPGKIDSCNLPTLAALATLPSLAPVINGSWDLGTTPLQTAPFTYTYKAKTSGFSLATFSDSMAYAFGTGAGMDLTFWRNVQQSSTGVVILGEEIVKRQAKGLGPFTGNTLDSITFGTQAIVYNNTLPIIKFPATMSSKWSASAIRTVNFNLTVMAASINNAPGQHKQIRSSIDSVVGWGRMKVPIAGKAASAWIAVLQVQHSDVGIDSFFLNGSAASSTLLTPLGLAQGQSNTVARTLFYRAGAYRPLIEAVHSTPSHSSTLSKFYMHALNLPEETSVQTIPGVGDIKVYPNPVRNGRLQIELPESNTASWSYSLIDISGQQVAQGRLKLSSGSHSTSISLARELKPGIYYISLMNADARVCVLPVTIE